jgi:hypothetical protein
MQTGGGYNDYDDDLQKALKASMDDSGPFGDRNTGQPPDFENMFPQDLNQGFAGLNDSTEGINK